MAGTGTGIRQTAVPKTGGLMLGHKDSKVFSGAEHSAIKWNVWYEVIGSKEISKRFPAFRPDYNTVALYEKMPACFSLRHALPRIFHSHPEAIPGSGLMKKSLRSAAWLMVQFPSIQQREIILLES